MDEEILYRVIDKELCKLIGIISGYKTTNSKAHYFQSNGILVRLGIVRRSFEFFFSSLSELPHNDYECETVNLMLNSIYLHIRGILDNLAWLIFYELYLQELHLPRDIDFAGNHYQKALISHTEILSTIQEFLPWMIELKEKRDPIAHRLPLYIPANFIDNDEDLQKAFALKARAKEKMKKNDESWINDEFEAMYIGEYKPIILNLDVENGICKPYPIVPEMKKDIENFSTFITRIFSLLKESKRHQTT